VHAAIALFGSGCSGFGGSQQSTLGKIGCVGKTSGVASDNTNARATIATTRYLLDLSVV